jgi:broad specificity phosphatase PhoE
MSKAEIIAELTRLSAEERAEIRARLDELEADGWLDGAELSDDDKRALDAELAAYQKSPDEGSSWDDVRARIEAKLRQQRGE